MKTDAMWMLKRLKMPTTDPYILGKDFKAFCKMNKFDCAFHGCGTHLQPV